MGDQADALRTALLKVDEMTQLLRDHAYDMRTMSALDELKERLTAQLSMAERAMRSEWQHGPAFTSGAE